MHEFALYGQVAKDDHHRMLQQLAGYTRMQPQDVAEIHLVFKARSPPGLDLVLPIGASHLVSQQDAQKVKAMLNAGLYYIQLVGEVVPEKSSLTPKPDGDVTMTNGSSDAPSESFSVRWALEFKDTPDPGKQAVSSRLISRTPIDEGDLIQFMDSFGYEYLSRYVVVGSRFYDRDSSLFVHKVLRPPQVGAKEALGDRSLWSGIRGLPELDGSGGYIVQASVEVIDGNNPELKDRATRQLLGLKEALKQAVDLTPGDRLALDTRLPNVSRRA